MKHQLFDVDGRVAVVTGVAGGIGAAVADLFAQVGVTVAGIDLQKDPDLSDSLSMYVPCDLSDPQQVMTAAHNIADRLSGVDILVNAAAIAVEGDADEVPVSDWDRVVDVNARGTYLCCQEFGRGMRERRYGKIVNFSSRLAFVGYPGYLTYNVSKAAVNSITKTFAVEWAPYNITVNALAPGFVRTPMTEYVWSDPDRLRSVLDRTPLNRMAEPEEITGVVLFFASPASDFVTGTVLPVDGGMLAY